MAARERSEQAGERASGRAGSEPVKTAAEGRAKADTDREVEAAAGGRVGEDRDRRQPSGERWSGARGCSIQSRPSADLANRQWITASTLTASG